MMSIKFYLADLVQRSELNVPTTDLTDNSLQTGLQMVFGVAGGIALLIVTLGAFKYVLSQGNAQETGKAKNTILYALIGLAVCILSFSIVTFVLDRV